MGWGSATWAIRTDYKALYSGPVVSYWTEPEGVRVLPDGAWRVGGFAIVHPASLRHLKAHLMFDEQGAFVVDGAQRMPILLEGPPFQVVGLLIDPRSEQVRAVLDDGSVEELGDSLVLNEGTGRFECAARGGRTRAVFSRTAHQVLLEHVQEEGGGYSVSLGGRRIPITT